MNKELQKHQIAKMLKDKGVDPATVDLEALVDPRLSLPENITVVAEVVGAKLYNGEQVENMSSKQIEDEVETVNQHNHEEFARAAAGPEPAGPTVKDKVLKLLRDKPEYAEVLKGIVEVEKTNPMKETIYQVEGDAWRFEDVDLNPGHLGNLIQLGIVKKVVDTQSCKAFRLAERNAIDEAIKEDGMLKAETVKKPWVPNVTEEDIEEFKRILEKHDGLNFWAPFINPKVSMMDRQKKAILLTLASLDDRFGDRHRIHTLLYGDPGTAKSELREWVSLKLNIASCSHRSTDVGLTGDARGNEITPGALPVAHGNALTIDELDKFDKRDQYGLLECMSEGVVTITAGGKQASFPAETRIVACANKIEDFSPELLDRFDFAIKCVNPNKPEGKTIMTDIIEVWGKPKKDYGGQKLAKFITWIRSFDPYLNDEVRKRMIELINGYIDSKNVETVNIRQHEKIMRIALAIARLNHRDLKYEDALEAIRLIDQEFDNHYKLMQLNNQQ